MRSQEFKQKAMTVTEKKYKENNKVKEEKTKLKATI